MRERGLKHPLIQDVAMFPKVAPHTGAWIKTYFYSGTGIRDIVAPHAGAWIETFLSGQQRNLHSVAPHTGARNRPLYAEKNYSE